MSSKKLNNENFLNRKKSLNRVAPPEYIYRNDSHIPKAVPSLNSNPFVYSSNKMKIAEPSNYFHQRKNQYHNNENLNFNNLNFRKREENMNWSGSQNIINNNGNGFHPYENGLRRDDYYPYSYLPESEYMFNQIEYSPKTNRKEEEVQNSNFEIDMGNRNEFSFLSRHTKKFKPIIHAFENDNKYLIANLDLEKEERRFNLAYNTLLKQMENKRAELICLIGQMEFDLEDDLKRMKRYKILKFSFNDTMGELEERIINKQIDGSCKIILDDIKEKMKNSEAKEESLIRKRESKEVFIEDDESDSIGSIKHKNENEKTNRVWRYHVEKDDKGTIEIELPGGDNKEIIMKATLSNKNCFEILFELLKKMLFSMEVLQTDLDYLNEKELILLKAFLVKRKIVKINKKLNLKAEIFNTQYKLKTTRRKEENLKHVIMLVIKFLRNKFRENNKKFVIDKHYSFLSNKDIIDFCFYCFYFGKIADKNKWSIQRFYHPKIVSKRKNNAEENERLKSINSEYIRYIRKSAFFTKDMVSFLDNNYKDEEGKQFGILDHAKELVLDKLTSKFNYWDEMMRSFGETKGFDKVLKDISKNPKCKLPWSMSELEEAIADVKRQLEI